VADPASLVNTIVGTTGGGNTFPGADAPFGMIQWSPDTMPNRSQGGGYDATDKQLIGFSLTHISGPGCGAMGDIPILPMVGGLPSGDPGAHLEPFTHTGEIGTAGYYSVQSGTAPSTITTELTATEHSAMARFTFPSTANANIDIKLLASENGATGSNAKIVGSNEVQGSIQSGHFCGAGDVYTLNFDIVFDQPFTASQIVDETSGPGAGAPNVVFLTFDTTKTQVLQAKVAISFVSVDNAKANWTAENSAWSFDTTRTATHAAWNALLNQIQIAGGTATEQQLFYTSLYHTLLHPNVFSDTNGQYMGFDSQVHSVSGTQKAQYANYSGWDIYRGQVQLSALLAPAQMSDSAQSMLNDAAQNAGQLPKWSLANAETYVMVGDPADGIIAGYYAFGATSFDTATALKVMLAEANTPNNIRPGLNYYETLGYLPDDGNYGCCNFYGSVSTVLEYAQADFALSQFASALGDTSNAAKLLARSQNWQNIFDPSTGLFTPRLLNGTFVAGVGPTSGQGMVEGSAAQYQFEQPFDRQALITAMGGPSAVNTVLSNYFSQLDSCSFNAANACFGNEMDMGQEYWQSYTGQPWATQNVVNILRTQTFQDAPQFIDNNDDLGAMSAMVAWSMLGLYPAYPGSAVTTLNTPEFPAALIHLPGGATLAIHAPGASANTPYIQSLQVNGKTSTATWLAASFMKSGGTLDFAVGSTPNKSWGTGAGDAPPSYGADSTAAIGYVQQSGPIVLAPGASANVTIGAQSTRADVSQSVTWKLTAPAGFGVKPANGTFSLAAGAKGTQALSFTAPTTQGQYQLPVQLSSSLTVPCPSQTINVIVAQAGALWPYFNDYGITNDSSSNAVDANYDGAGYSYSAKALAGGTPAIVPGTKLKVGNVTYNWPNTAAGQPDNIVVGGQTIQLAANGPKHTLGLLGSATNAGSTGATGTLTVTYADTTTQSVSIGFSDWTLGGGQFTMLSQDTVAATTAYRDANGGQDPTKAYVYASGYALTNTNSAPVSITLPSSTTGGTIQLFDIELQ
jgi:predicted alpha-1,2-mannosidase